MFKLAMAPAGLANLPTVILEYLLKHLALSCGGLPANTKALRKERPGLRIACGLRAGPLLLFVVGRLGRGAEAGGAVSGILRCLRAGSI